MEKVIHYFQQDQFARLVNAELVSVAPGSARAKMSIQPHHLNAYKTVQGGAIFTLADYAFAAASNAHGTVAVGINVSISYMKAATGGTLWADARELTRNARLASYTVDVRDDAGDLVAVFQGMVYRKKEPISN